jgi:hypothetical protein
MQFTYNISFKLQDKPGTTIIHADTVESNLLVFAQVSYLTGTHVLALINLNLNVEHHINYPLFNIQMITCDTIMLIMVTRETVVVA